MENEKSPQQIANEALPSTVLLEMEDANGQRHAGGSGFFVREDEIATNFHVVEGTDKGSAKLFGQDELYDIEGYTALDVDNDLVILKIKNPDQKLLTYLHFRLVIVTMFILGIRFMPLVIQSAWKVRYQMVS